MIEFDVCLTKDNKMVIIHDLTVDRTTNGKGKVSDLTLEEIKKLDAGIKKSPAFKGERIPTLNEVLQIMPVNIWLNVHIKDQGNLPVLAAETIAKENRLHQAFLACGASAANKARAAVPDIIICNMDRQDSNLNYVMATAEMKAGFIQLLQPLKPEFSEYTRILKNNGIKVNFYGTDSPEEIRKLFEYGVDFPLVNDISKSMLVAGELKIEPAKPVFAPKSDF